MTRFPVPVPHRYRPDFYRPYPWKKYEGDHQCTTTAAAAVIKLNQEKKANNIEFLYVLIFYHHLYFPVQLAGDFTLSDLRDKPWSQVSSLPPGTCFQLLSRIGFSITIARRFSSNVVKDP